MIHCQGSMQVSKLQNDGIGCPFIAHESNMTVKPCYDGNPLQSVCRTQIIKKIKVYFKLINMVIVP
jgi:hypothetical protein